MLPQQSSQTQILVYKFLNLPETTPPILAASSPSRPSDGTPRVAMSTICWLQNSQTAWASMAGRPQVISCWIAAGLLQTVPSIINLFSSRFMLLKLCRRRAFRKKKTIGVSCREMLTYYIERNISLHYCRIYKEP